MENSPTESQQPINVLTVADLEALIVKIVQKVLKKESLQENTTSQTNQAFLNTFGTWEAPNTAEEIILYIYNSRTHPNNLNNS